MISHVIAKNPYSCPFYDKRGHDGGGRSFCGRSLYGLPGLATQPCTRAGCPLTRGALVFDADCPAGFFKDEEAIKADGAAYREPQGLYVAEWPLFTTEPVTWWKPGVYREVHDAMNIRLMGIQPGRRECAE